MNNKGQVVPPTKKELWTIRVMIVIGCFSVLNFMYWLLQPEFGADPLLYALLCFTMGYGILRVLYIWYHYWDITIPKIPDTKETLTVDILTTYFPGEPYEMIVDTLTAIQNITYSHTTYLCDEANDPYLRKVCKELGVRHVARNNRINAKAGNINNALQMATGEICVVLDPDHIPHTDFLDPIIPFFNDPKIGFVQIVQSYYNINETLVAKGAAEQTFQFYGPMMMTMNAYGTVNAIGANCTFRRAALDSIGGHAAGLSEDMHTAMLLHAKGWTSVYVPQVLAKGLVPSSLTAFYKQQLKWARGTFDLLFYVYPKLFTKFTLRQKIHYGLLPLHYLVGVAYLINFLIPILSLFLFKMPWSGNIFYFGMIVLPMVMSVFLIRAYIQEWVIEKNERGFHIVGGLLQITTWWLYFLGFVYTIFRKKIPYIPTPKQGDEFSNYKIIVPNLVVAGLSISAIIYGLSKDFTPFSIVMAGFALLNAGFMMFGVYLTNQRTNRNRLLSEGGHKNIEGGLKTLRGWYYKIRENLFHRIRPVALGLLGSFLLLSVFAQVKFTQSQWQGIEGVENLEVSTRYLGIFLPKETNGISDNAQIAALEHNRDLKFDIISLYIPWGDKDSISSSSKAISGIYDKKAIPMITWEPWTSNFEIGDSLSELKKGRNGLKYIKDGHFDNYVKKFAIYLKSFNKPVFLRFAHEFDNPFYPWSKNGGNSPEDFKAAWIHVHKIFQRWGANNVVWVWNPWTMENMKNYFPGDRYVDWIGITGLNYGLYNNDQQWHSFKDLYAPFHGEIKNITDKPVMISEFGSLKKGGDQAVWIDNALKAITGTFKEIKAVVVFNSALDKNLPKNVGSEIDRLDWSLDSFTPFQLRFTHGLPEYVFKDSLGLVKRDLKRNSITLPIKPIRAVAYKKGQNWMADNFVLSRDVLMHDFDLMKNIGLHAIRYEGSNVYDYNVIHSSREKGISLIYGFWVPSSIDFVMDHKAKLKLAKHILHKVGKLKEEEHILSWNIGNDTWFNLNGSFDEPILSYQRKAYLVWLRKLIADIKKIDSSRPITIDVQLNHDALDRIAEMQELGIANDLYGLLVKDVDMLDSFLGDPQSREIPYMINDIGNQSFLDSKAGLKNKAVVLRNWQDQWENNKVSFDGLLDYKGRKKAEYGNFISGTSDIILEPLDKVRVLVPSKLLYPGNSVVYHAVILKEGEWMYPNSSESNEAFEWILIKKDAYGNELAIKDLGKGVSKSIIVPKDYPDYELMLIYNKGNTVNSVRTQLNTRLLNILDVSE